MTPVAWIALATLALLILSAFGGGVWYLARLIGALPGMIAVAIRDHERSCAGHEHHTSPRLMAVAADPPA